MPSEAAPDTLGAEGHGDTLTYSETRLSMGFPNNAYLSEKESKKKRCWADRKQVCPLHSEALFGFILMKEARMTGTVLNN